MPLPLAMTYMMAEQEYQGTQEYVNEDTVQTAIAAIDEAERKEASAAAGGDNGNG
jgi:hypothetical protein